MKGEDIHVRISKDLKDKFIEKCNRLSINKSEWFRKKIKEFVKEDKQ